nr:nucleic acid/nucleotide deaminase domain-containing protein [Streptomyces sp. HNM0574]
MAGVEVPLAVSPYFTTAEEDHVVLREYADSVGRRVVEPHTREWARIGTDGGAEICADHEGAVHAVFLALAEPTRFVNASTEAFARSLDALDRALGLIFGADSPQAASTAFRELQEQLQQFDPQACAERENWWPLVLDDIRDTAGAEWYSAFEVLDGQGEKHIVTQSGGIGIHPEEKLWQSLQAAGVEPEQVLRIHTDLEACFMPGHYCSLWLGEVFPDAKLSHSFPYGESAASRAEGIRLLREAPTE